MLAFYSSNLQSKISRYAHFRIVDYFQIRRLMGYIYFLPNNKKTLGLVLSLNIRQVFDEENSVTLYNYFNEFDQIVSERKQVMFEIRKLKAKIEFGKYYPAELPLTKIQINSFKQELKELEKTKNQLYVKRRECWAMGRDLLDTAKPL